jgi:muramoyltetrapeptide carboxypeptidase
MRPRCVPPILKEGDKIAIAAPARKVSVEEISNAVEIFEAWGLEVVTHQNLYAQQDQFAGSDETRIEVFQSYINDPSIQAIICARGGYGTVRIIDQIDFSILEQYPKWIIGYSDVTVLHSHINRNTNCCSLHATMPINMQHHNKHQPSIDALKTMLFTKQMEHQLPKSVLNRNGEAEAELVGGNLSVLYSLLGSASDVNTNGKLLFIEDLDEYLYHVDRMIQALKRAGKLTYLKGLIVGGMSHMKDNAIPFGKTAEEIILNAVKEYAYPVSFNFPAGHLSENVPLVIGAKYLLRNDNNGVKLKLS